MMKHKGYTASVWFEADDHAFHGTVAGIKDVIHFTATSVIELEQAFRDSVDEYLAVCKENDINPQKAYSGTLSLRISPELHLKAAAKAKEKGTSVNALIEKAVSEAV